MNWNRLFVLLAGITVAGCAHSSKWNNDHALGCETIEMQVTQKGTPTEIEFHVAASEAPEAVHKAMKEMYPGIRLTGAEKENEGGKFYWELQGVANGMEVEAMFTPDGKLHSEEIQVAANTVPDAVKKAAAGAVSGGRVTAWEEIRNAERELVEYHVKIASGNKKWKVLISTDGNVMAVYREVPAEIEVRLR